MQRYSRSGTVVDVVHKKIFPATVHVDKGKIVEITIDVKPKTKDYILPGFIDAHVHVESSMLIPSEFARLATVHGTVGSVSDPHEIANVLGVEGIHYMIRNGKQVPFHFCFGASSCVPATCFETAGATITAQDIEKLFSQDGLQYLSEVMNYPGVLHRDPEVIEKIRIAQAYGKPVDGHAPDLRGDEARQYIDAGISTDHECFELDEALDKIEYGMHILIREGSAAKNYEVLHPLIGLFPDKVMFCSDDKHPHELVKGHINEIVKRSVRDKKYDLMDVLRAASYNPIKHYKLDVGLLQQGDSADFIVVNNLEDFDVLETYVNGELVAERGKALIQRVRATAPNKWMTKEKKAADFVVQAKSTTCRVILAEDGQLITRSKKVATTVVNNEVVCNIDQDILKLTVVNRYQDVSPAVAFIQNFGLKRGALASCIAHDSHNIIAVGCSDEEICAAVNALVQHKGGIAAVDGREVRVLPLDVAGIMSNEDGYVVAREYAEIDQFAKELGTKLSAPFMTLSFMALLVIPELKLSDKGLFDGKLFAFVSDT